jgi:hypothetical protein
MKNTMIIVAAIVVVVGAVLIFMNRGASPSPANPVAPQSVQQPAVSAPASPAGRSITLMFNAQNNSGEGGTAVLSDENGKTKVVLNITGQPANVLQPAHIHTGSCANLGGVKYPLTFPMNGKSETTIDVSLDQLLTQLPLAINVHKSASEITVYTACADIMTTSGATSTPPAPTPVQQPQASTPAPSPAPSTSGGYNY